MQRNKSIRTLLEGFNSKLKSPAKWLCLRHQATGERLVGLLGSLLSFLLLLIILNPGLLGLLILGSAQSRLLLCLGWDKHVLKNADTADMQIIEQRVGGNSIWMHKISLLHQSCHRSHIGFTGRIIQFDGILDL